MGKEKVEVKKPEDLPSLKEGFARLVHLTQNDDLASYKENGLRYNGDVNSTARIWADEKKVDYAAPEDERFVGAYAIVYDVPADELKIHQGRKSRRGIFPPGVIPSKYFVGVVKDNRERKFDPPKVSGNGGGKNLERMFQVFIAIAFIVSIFFVISKSTITGNVTGVGLLTPQFFDVFGFVGFLILLGIGISLIKIAKVKSIVVIVISSLGIIVDGYIVLTNFIF